MISRTYIVCKTCGAPHTLRVSLGHTEVQKHTFPCRACNEEIQIAVHLDKENVSWEFKYLNNCSEGSVEGHILNLHPELTLPKDLLNQDGCFPALGHMFDIVSPYLKALPEKGSHTIDARNFLEGEAKKHSISQEWMMLKKVWSLSTSEKYDLAERLKSKYLASLGYEALSLREWQYEFLNKFMLQHWEGVLDNLLKFAKKAFDKSPSEFDKFRSHYKSNLKVEHFHNYYELLSEYFKSFDEYGQSAIYAKLNIEIPEGHVVTSMNFDATKMYYGDAFEILTSHYTILACLNNISRGRNFDQFETMDLKKYITLDKANKTNPFKDEVLLEEFIKVIDSGLRNASHHKNMKIRKETGIVEYMTGKGGKTLNKITYANYLELCNRMTFTAMALFIFEIAMTNDP